MRIRVKDWGECMLTFDKIKEAVRAKDGHVYERWAIEKWLSENGNRSSLTNQIIDPTLQVLTDEDEGQGARHVDPSPTPPRESAGNVGGAYNPESPTSMRPAEEGVARRKSVNESLSPEAQSLKKFSLQWLTVC